jgi:ribosomal protein S18 acetylase RimI-like enzyme
LSEISEAGKQETEARSGFACEASSPECMSRHPQSEAERSGAGSRNKDEEGAEQAYPSAPETDERPAQDQSAPEQPKPAIKIQRASESDIHKITHLFVDYQRRFGETNPIFDKIEAFLREKIESAGYTLFFAEKDGKPVGFAGLYPIFSSVTFKREWLLNDLFVSENYRRQGVGAALINEVKSRLSESSQGIMLISSKQNAEAKAFYEKNGFSDGGNEFLRIMF